MMNIQQCIVALKSSRLDSAGFILLAPAILSEKAPAVAGVIADVYRMFDALEYEKCHKIIAELIKKLPEDLDRLAQQLRDAQRLSITNDNPNKNDVRRYYETKVSQGMWESVLHKEGALQSIMKLAQCMNDAPKTEKKSSLPSSPPFNHIDAETVVGFVRDFAEINLEAKATSKSFRNQRGSVYPTKDRGKKRGAEGERLLSMNPGIVKAHAPMPANEVMRYPEKGPVQSEAHKKFTDYSTLAAVNRVPDSCDIDLTIVKGFSKTRPTVPYVNSISGSTYALMATLTLYAKTHHHDPEFKNDISFMLEAFVAFSGKNGYHSMTEIFEVFHDAGVQEFFKQYNIPFIVPDEAICSVARNAATEYAAHINAVNVVQAELKRTSQLLRDEIIESKPSEDPYSPKG